MRHEHRPAGSGVVMGDGGKEATGHRPTEMRYDRPDDRRVPKETGGSTQGPNSIRHWLSCRMLVREQNAAKPSSWPRRRDGQPR
jgi:hypothetical protein